MTTNVIELETTTGKRSKWELDGTMVRKTIKEAASAQIALCACVGAEFVPSSPRSTIGLATQTLEHPPLHGLRHLAVTGTTGWFIWGGDYSEDPQFFKPIHVERLDRMLPQILPYLGLSPGWRFLIAAGYEDVWFDETIVHVLVPSNSALHRTRTRNSERRLCYPRSRAGPRR
jgi:hypothetical protein